MAQDLPGRDVSPASATQSSHFPLTLANKSGYHISPTSGCDLSVPFIGGQSECSRQWIKLAFDDENVLTNPLPSGILHLQTLMRRSLQQERAEHRIFMRSNTLPASLRIIRILDDFQFMLPRFTILNQFDQRGKNTLLPKRAQERRRRKKQLTDPHPEKTSQKHPLPTPNSPPPTP
ncbi:hypothetical protein Slin14017_G093910 [Septoria linicola]|nr:hypothetical protein Slin14017_G093910 [Septoria linicola]